MALFKNGGFADDPSLFPTPDDPIPTTGSITLGKTRLLAEWVGLARRNEPVGLILESGENLDGLEAIIPKLGLIALRIPKYTDGRAYSTARLLRDRHGYTGELRATGDVLRDQIALMLRAGFDAVEITHAGTIQALREHRIIAVRRHYQPASAEASEEKPAGRPWLRVSPAI